MRGNFQTIFVKEDKRALSLFLWEQIKSPGLPAGIVEANGRKGQYLSWEQQTYRPPFLSVTPTHWKKSTVCLFLFRCHPGETSRTSLAQSLQCSCSGIVQSTAISESYCTLQTVSAVSALTLIITKQMGFWKFTSKFEIFDGCYNERICDYTGIHNTLKSFNFWMWEAFLIP